MTTVPTIKVLEGKSGDVSGQVAIVVSRYNESITGKLLLGSLSTLKSAGIPESAIVVAKVPGAWELSLIAQDFAKDERIVGVLALGCVIRGETTHDQYINSAVSQSLMQISLATAKPVAFGLLTCNTLDQAIHRSGGNVGNKGEEAAEALLEMLRIRKQIAGL